MATRRQQLNECRISEAIFESGNESSESNESFDCEEYTSDNSEVLSSSEGSESESVQPRKRQRANPNPTSGDSEWMEGMFSPVLFPWQVVNSGLDISCDISNTSKEIDYFKIFFNHEIIETVVTETNRYYLYTSGMTPPSEHSKLRRWKDVDHDELFVFLALVLLMAFVKELSHSDYWSTEPMISTPFFTRIMTCDRFKLILRLLHFNDNLQEANGDKLFKIRPVIDLLKSTFSSVFHPYQNLVIDESLMLWKGRLSFKQYIPKKHHRFGIKFFILSDCKTGYIVNFIVYTGSNTDHLPPEGDLGISGAVVWTLMEPYLDKGYTLYTDNWYTSPSLANKLHERMTGTCGTVRPNRKGMPNFQKLKKGEWKEKHKNNLLAVKWHDRRDVHMLTTISDTGLQGTGKVDHKTKEEIQKPRCIIQYNKNMGAVDKSDMQLSFVECVRKSQKWYK